MGMAEVPPKKKSHREEIRERGERIANLIRYKKETQIAEILRCSRATVVRHVRVLKKQNQEWLDDLAKEGFIFEYRNTLEKIKERGARLEEMYQKTNDPLLKLDILREQDRNDKLYLEMLGETPTIHAYRKAVKLANVQVA